MPLNPLSRHRAIVDAEGKPTQLMQLYTEELRSWSESPTVTGSLTFDGVGNRIAANLSDAVTANRLLFENSLANMGSSIGVIPSGSAASSAVVAYNNNNPDIASFIAMSITTTEANLASTRNGAASYLPLRFASGGTTRFELDIAGNVRPLADNAYTNGASGLRWSAVWAANGTIQTSDIRTKTDIEDSVLGLDFINYLEPISYKFIVGGNDVTPGPTEEETVVTPRPGVRTHWGFSAQHVKQIADIFGVDFGGHVLTDLNDPESQQGLRMDQFIAPLVKAIQEQSVIIDQLNARIEALENE